MAIVTATELTSFDGTEEPDVRYVVATGCVEDDPFPNITGGGGLFRMSLRFHAGEWWDGDRRTCAGDRQRAEVKGLGEHHCLGDTFVYGTTWRSNPDLRPAGGFCHIFQLKAMNDEPGDDPLVTVSLLAPGRAALKYAPAGETLHTAHTFVYTPGEWQTLQVRVTLAAAPGGEVQVTVGDTALEASGGLDLQRAGHNEYRPKWGFYRATAGLSTSDDFIEHKDVTAEKL